MLLVSVIDVDRPGLPAAFAARGLGLVQADEVPAATLARGLATCGPLLVEARCAVHAADLLDGGADDVVLASDPDALVAARLARLARAGPPALLRCGALTVDTIERRVSVGGRTLALLPREYAVLLHLLRHAGTTVTRAALRRAVWGIDYDPGTNVIEVHVSRLRAKLRPDGPALVTDKGRGYRLVTTGADG